MSIKINHMSNGIIWFTKWFTLVHLNSFRTKKSPFTSICLSFKHTLYIKIPFKVSYSSAGDLKFWHNAYHTLCVLCPVLHVRCHMPGVICHLSCVLCHIVLVSGVSLIYKAYSVLFLDFFRNKNVLILNIYLSRLVVVQFWSLKKVNWWEFNLGEIVIG